jgi:DNA-binding NtrC family response regulator
VEDEAILRVSTANIIRDEGFEVIEAANAHEAIALLQTNTPVDIVMTDVKMPGTIDGVGLTLFIRANRPALKVVMTSANLSASPAGCHVDTFIPKPYGASQVLRLIRSLSEDARSRIRRHGEC